MPKGKRKQEDVSDVEESSGKKPKLTEQSQLSRFWGTASANDHVASQPKTAGSTTTSTSQPPADAVDDLKELLDISALTSESEIEARFVLIAQQLLHYWTLSIETAKGTVEYDFLEFEFYLKHPELHLDPYTHGSLEQKVSAKWYFHRPPTFAGAGAMNITKLEGYRGGTRKGLDVTLGGSESNTEADIRGGILLRTIRRRSDNLVISGPSKLVDEVLAKSGVSEIADLVQGKWSGDTSAFAAPDGVDRKTTLTVTKSSKLAKVLPVIHRSPRIGLDLANSQAKDSPTNPRVIYVQRAYRFFVQPTLLTANGRYQTLLGLYHEILVKNPQATANNAVTTLSALSRIKANTVSSYLDHFKAGLESKDLKPFIGTSAKGTCASPSQYLRMMGVLWSMRQSS